MADGEGQEAWEQLKVSLEARRMYRERGVELFVHDGGAELAALRLLYPFISHQHRLFHKLRNLRDAIRVAPERKMFGLHAGLLYTEQWRETKIMRAFYA